MIIYRKLFYDEIRQSLFNGSLTDSQVNCMESFINFYEYREDYKIHVKQLAYIFATIYHETAKTFLPIEEYGKGKNYDYGKPDSITGQTYYGRGYVQLTWKYNYEKASQKLGIDFVNNPSLVMKSNYAQQICIVGMLQGWFTGKKLSDYLTIDKTDFVGARKIINGIDKAQLIASYAEKFHKALTIS